MVFEVVVASVIGPLVFLLLPDRRKERLLREGKTVVAKVLMASPELYDTANRTPFGFAHVLFTLDDDHSAEHLAYLEEVGQCLSECQTTREADADERLITQAVTQPRTVGAIPLRIPQRLTRQQVVFFGTPSIMWRHFPDGCLSRDYIYLKVIVDAEDRGLMMIEDPPRSRRSPERRTG